MGLKTTEGVIFRVTTKNFRGTDLYSLKIDNDEWYRIGEERHAGVLEEGYTVKLGWEEDGKGNRHIKKCKLVEKGEPVKSGGKSSGNAGGGNGGGGYQGGGNREANITYNAAVARAIEMVDVLLTHEIVKLPAKTKATERQAAVDGLVDLYTARFFQDSVGGHKAIERASDELDAPDEVKGGKAESSDDDWDEGGSDDGEEW